MKLIFIYGSPAVEMCGEMEEKFDKEYQLKFYSRELLFSDEARAKFIADDLVDSQG